MNGGRVEQLGAPADLYENPGTAFVADFLGTSNLIAAEIAEIGGTVRAGGDLVLAAAGGAKLTLPAARCRATARTGRKILAGVRPEKISLVHAADAAAVPAGRNQLSGRVVDSSFTGVSTQYVVDSPAAAGLAVYEQNIERDTRLGPGAEVVLHWNPAHTFGLDAGQDAAADAEAARPFGAGI